MLESSNGAMAHVDTKKTEANKIKAIANWSWHLLNHVLSEAEIKTAALLAWETGRVVSPY